MKFYRFLPGGMKQFPLLMLSIFSLSPALLFPGQLWSRKSPGSAHKSQQKINRGKIVMSNNAMEIRKNPLLEGLVITDLPDHTPALQEDYLSDGTLVLTAPDSSLPFLTIELIFPGGSSVESLNETGNLQALTTLMQIGGAGELNGEAFAAELARIGARLQIKAGYEKWTVTLTVLREHYQRGFTLMEMMLSRPLLPANQLAVIKDGMRNELRQRNDDPARVVRRKLYEAMFPGSSLGRSLQMTDIDRIQTDHLRADLKNRLGRRNGMIVTLSGDVDGLTVKSDVEKLLQSFPVESEKVASRELDYAILKKFPSPLYGKILLVDSPAHQAAIIMGSYLPAHNDADFFALQTGNYTLGGGSFNSRMMHEIRVLRGLSYDPYTTNVFFGNFGYMIGYSGTMVEKADVTLSLMLSIVQSMSEGVTPAELALAKDSIVNSTLFQYDDPYNFVTSEARFHAHSMPPGYLKIFPEKIRELNGHDIVRVNDQYRNPEKFFIVVAGPAKTLKPALEKILPVTVIQPEDPPPAGSLP